VTSIGTRRKLATYKEAWEMRLAIQYELVESLFTRWE